MTKHKRRIHPTHGFLRLDLHELWGYRDLLMLLAGRDVRLRYKQTVLGVVWVVLQPLVTSVIFAVVFGAFARLPSDGLPYLLFALCGLVPWTLFASSLLRAGNSLVGNASLISKVYFPRVLLPLASNGAVLVDFAVSLVMLFVFMAVFQIAPTWRLFALPLFLLLTLTTVLGVSLWFSALNVYYRDLTHVMPLVVQVWTYASPVAYATSIVPERWQWLYSLNPAVGFIEGFRWALLGSSVLTPSIVVTSCSVALLTFLSGVYVFRRIERGFADVI